MIGSDVRALVAALKENHPHIYACVDLDRVEQLNETTATSTDDFGAASAGGRGDSYIVAQQATLTRAHGVQELVGIITRHGRADSDMVLDLLGGDGLINRVRTSLGHERPLIVTCDASPFMVEAALALGIPAVLQRAEASLFRTSSVGGVLLAYGTHHIGRESRQTVADEAFRVIQPGGVFVLHDFATGSPVDTWFGKVVDAYSATGHRYDHFERDEIASYLHQAGFADVNVITMEDPFQIWGNTADQAEQEMGRYLVNMYGLVKLEAEFGPQEAGRRAMELGRDIFRYAEPDGTFVEAQTEYDETRQMWSTTLPRRALVGYGTKPRSQACA
ncbi:methyltransferase domain-containing protein [Nonomuraea sp. NPDC046570]|uniref:class I SAM-dependent methyltransferase n=1 Tax=Nonomuraea sp. NPDC046570 TaxID=3155255 RepID=UPI0033E2DAD8